MSTETRYEATETGIDIIPHGQEDWRNSITYPHSIGRLSYENVADMLNAAYRNGRNEQREDIRKALDVR